jgi:hypothetical protein
MSFQRAAAMSSSATLATAAARPPPVPTLNLASLGSSRNNENLPPPLPRGSTPNRPAGAGSHTLAAALSAAAARGLDSALLTSWGSQPVAAATPVPPIKGVDAGTAARHGPMARRTLLSDTGTSYSGVLDLTKAGATPLQDTASASISLPVADIDALSRLIGHATYRDRAGTYRTSEPSKKQRKHRGRSAGGNATDRGGAKTSSLLPQFTKGFSFYMKRWDPSYYFGPSAAPADSAPPSAAKPPPQSPRVKPVIAGVAHQSMWSAAAAAAKEKIAAIEADHEKQRKRSLFSGPKLIQVRMHMRNMRAVETPFRRRFYVRRHRCSNKPRSRLARQWDFLPRSGHCALAIFALD